MSGENSTSFWSSLTDTMKWVIILAVIVFGSVILFFVCNHLNKGGEVTTPWLSIKNIDNEGLLDLKDEEKKTLKKLEVNEIKELLKIGNSKVPLINFTRVNNDRDTTEFSISDNAKIYEILDTKGLIKSEDFDISKIYQEFKINGQVTELYKCNNGNNIKKQTKNCIEKINVYSIKYPNLTSEQKKYSTYKIELSNEGRKYYELILGIILEKIKD